MVSPGQPPIDPEEKAELLAIARSAKRFAALADDAKDRVLTALKADLEERHPEMIYRVERLKTGQVHISVTPR